MTKMSILLFFIPIKVSSGLSFLCDHPATVGHSEFKENFYCAAYQTARAIWLIMPQ